MEVKERKRMNSLMNKAVKRELGTFDKQDLKLLHEQYMKELAIPKEIKKEFPKKDLLNKYRFPRV